MQSELTYVALAEIAASVPNAVAAGPFGSNLVSRDYVECGVPVIRGQNLTGRWVTGDFVYVSNAKASQLRTNTAGPGDIVFTQRGTLGQVSLVPTEPFALYVVSQSQMKLTVDTRKADPRFVYYACSSPNFLTQVNNNAVAAGVPHINLGILRNLRVPLPAMRVQTAVADVLSAIDDRIDLLRQTNVTLESIAQALFKSWFIDFDPVRAKAEGREPEGMDAGTAALFPAEFEESKLGLIPRGWGASTVGEVFRITMGQSPPGDTYNQEGVGTPFYQGRADFGFRFPTTRVYCTSPTRYAERGNVLVSVRAPVGDVNVTLETCAVGRGVAAVVLSGAPSFALYSMKALRETFSMYESHGTVFGSINKKQFETLPCVMPSATVLGAFTAVVSAIDDRIRVNELQTRLLVEIRDSMLPRLISGRLRIPEAEAAIESATGIPPAPIIANLCHTRYPVTMSTMNISLPDELKAFVDEQVTGRGYTSSSEYVRELLRREQDREKLRGMLHEGLESGPAREIDLAAYGTELRARITQRARQFEAAKGAARSRKPKARAR